MTHCLQAALDRLLFEAAPLRDRLRLVREEAMAMASERVTVPALLRGDASAEAATAQQAAYSLGLCMALTTHSSGWFRAFGHAHYPQVKDLDVDMAAKVGARTKDDKNIPALDAQLKLPSCLLAAALLVRSSRTDASDQGARRRRRRKPLVRLAALAAGHGARWRAPAQRAPRPGTTRHSRTASLAPGWPA